MEKNEVINILQNSFTTRWRALGGTIYKEIYSTILGEFLIDEIVNSVNEELNNSEKDSALRYQKYILSNLSNEFALILFLISNQGEDISHRTVIESQRLLKTSSKCKIHPCTKLFG